jgi:CRISPR-associated endonuclease Csn1
MGYVFGLDLGTSSIGAACINLDQHGLPTSILDHHVYIFKEPIVADKSGLVSKKANRRINRLARKQRDRKSGRLKNLANVCSQVFRTAFPDSLKYEGEAHSDVKTYQALALRGIAASQPIKLKDMTAVVLQFAKSRGYSSGFKPMSADKTKKLAESKTLDERLKLFTGDVQPGHECLASIMESRNIKTIGQYLLDRAKRDLPSNLKAADRPYRSQAALHAVDGEIQIEFDKKSGNEVAHSFQNLYALRDELKSEFRHIWDIQAKFHRSLNEENFKKIESILFFQRPLKSVLPMVGSCMLEPTLPRVPRCHPAFQAFRIEKQLADLRWGFGRNAKKPSKQELAVIRRDLNDPQNLNSNAQLTFEKIYQNLEPLRGSNAPQNLNLAKGGRDGLLGNVTNKRWHGLGLIQAWEKLGQKPSTDESFIDRQTWVINFLSDLGSVDLLYPDDWHQNFYLPNLPERAGKSSRYAQQAKMFSDALFIDFINQFRLNTKYDRLGALKFDSGRASYSLKATKQIVQWLEQQVDFADEYSAIEALYKQNNSAKRIVDLLENPAKVGNGVVDLALQQVKKVVNYFIAKHGKPERIVVEMARQMGEGIARRNELLKDQNKQRDSHKLAIKDMQSMTAPYSKTNLLRYRLAVDQGYRCPYCTNKLGARDIYNGAETNIEHIVPQSITQVGRKYSEVVLAHRACNDRKGNRVPLEAFAFNTGPILAMAEQLRVKKQERKAALLSIPETPENKLDDALLNDFCERQFNETAWITKLTATWLRTLGVNVECTRGQITAQMRSQWLLESVIPRARILENLPLYSTVSAEGEIKETLIPSEALIDAEDQDTLLWRYWDRQRLTPEDFTELHRSGVYQYDKRCDHRHHLIDAVTIALCDRSLVQRMAVEYKRQSDLNAAETPQLRRKIRFGRMSCPLPKLREQVALAVAERRVTHRPDRQVSGAWFQEGAYGLFTDKSNGNQKYLVRRYAVRELLGKDDAATVGEISKVIGAEVRASLLEDYKKYCARVFENGKAKDAKEYQRAMEQLWLNPPMHLRLKHPILKVKKTKTRLLQDKHMKVEHKPNNRALKPALYKYLIADENAYIAWNPARPEDGSKVVNNFSARRPGTTPSNWMRVFKGDTIIAKNGLAYLVRGLNESNNRIETMRDMCATASLKSTQTEGRRDFSLEPAKKAGSFSLWDIKEIKKDPFDGRSARIDD